MFQHLTNLKQLRLDWDILKYNHLHGDLKLAECCPKLEDFSMNADDGGGFIHESGYETVKNLSNLKKFEIGFFPKFCSSRGCYPIPPNNGSKI